VCELWKRRFPIRHPNGLFAPLEERNFALLFTGQICSLLGDQFYVVALPFLILRHAHARTLGAVLLAYGLARLVTLPVGGILADRVRRTWLMLGSDAGRMILLILLAFVSLTTLWPVFVLVILVGALEGIFLPPSMALLPDILDKDRIGPGNALMSGATMGATLVGPALAGLLVVATSPSVAFAVDAVTFGISALSLSWIRLAPTTSDEQPEPAEEDLTAADDAVPMTFLGLLRTSRFLQFGLLITLIANLAYPGAEQVALPVFSKVSLGTGARGYGLLLAAFGLGSLLGVLLSGRLFTWPARGKIALTLGVVQGVALALVPAGDMLWVGLVVLAIAGVCVGMNDVFYVSMLQQRLPSALLGRSMSALMSAAYAAYPASVLISGYVVGRFGTTPILVAGGLAVSAAFLLGFFSREFRNL
jgi:predicted MFS family arabinose efflux permease